jgi:hypothetical protein
MRRAADAEDERNPGTDLKVGHYKGENHKPAGCQRNKVVGSRAATKDVPRGKPEMGWFFVGRITIPFPC